MRATRVPLLVAALLIGVGGGATAADDLEVVFGDPGLPAKQKALLVRYARTVRTWAMVQRVVQAVREQNARQLAPERIEELERSWAAGQPPQDLLVELASNPCAQALQTLIAANPGYSEAQVAGDRGVVVCMSGRADGYWQGDDPEWVGAFADGHGAIYIGALRKEPVSGARFVPIAVPVLDGGRAIGVLTVFRLFGTAE
ncbi:MAG TPA: hypothetical protein VMT16_00405 [Thermoanaerobaculia bacterium]|nr:hypothetical protein [Thermoanaerobaculia bacterium]